MLGKSLSLGRYFGFQLKAHWSLLIIFALIATHIGFAVLPEWHPDWSIGLTAGVAIAASIVFFASIAIHEFAHAIAARGYGLEVSSITLFIFGGVSNIETEPNSPGSEAVIAIVGPLTSFVLGVAMLGLTGFLVPDLQAIQDDPLQFLGSLGPLTTILLWAGPVNLILAIFNMIPAFPMDGGRVLRSIVWGFVGEIEKATVIAATFSRFFSWAFIGVGVAMIFGVQIPLFGSGLINGLWIAVIGWFIGRAAKSTVIMQQMRNALEGVSSRAVASEDVHTVDASSRLQQVVDDYVGGKAGDRVLVEEGGRLVGVLKIDDVKSVQREQWSETEVRAVMSAREEVETLDADTDAFDAFKEMQKRGAPEIPITGSNDELEGVLRLQDFMRWMRVYGENDNERPPSVSAA